jgi:cysteinyl-tRNA synthetase
MADRALMLFNSDGRRLEEFQPRTPGRVGLYTCGLTVYNYAHIGNLRAYLFTDTLRRVLQFKGYDVLHVMNITDVGHLTSDADEGEDKMAASARKEGKTVWDIARYYTEYFQADLKKLNVIEPDVWCKATDHIPEMIALIQRLEMNGLTYIAGGNVMFDVSKFPSYGALARLNLGEQRAGLRVAVDEQKRSPHDFVLWFTRSKFGAQDMQWDSPWGRGFPGWHIECSAMSMKYLGERIDLHCSAVDHIPVHHTNEIAQSEGATGRQWVNCWMHGEFLQVDGGKMSKSLGNVYLIEDLAKRGYDPLAFRYFILGGHYRTQLNFTWEAMTGAQRAYENLMDEVEKLRSGEGKKQPPSDEGRIAAWKVKFHAAIKDDLNMPQALAVLWDLLKAQDLPARERLALALDFDRVLGLNLDQTSGDSLPDAVAALLEQRKGARQSKNWAESDRLRGEIAAQGYVVEDTAKGQAVRKKKYGE